MAGLSQVNEESVSKLSTSSERPSQAEKGKEKAKPLRGSGKKMNCEGTSTKFTTREETHTEMDDYDEELQEAELEAYIEEGANAGGDFPLNKDITLRQEMLSKHLTKL